MHQQQDIGYHERLLDHMLEGCQIIGFDWRYKYVNDVVAKHGRKGKEELIGKRMWEVYPGIDETPMFERLSRCMESRTPEVFINEFDYPDGSKGWFELSMQPIPDGVLVMSLDITKHEEAKSKISMQMNRLKTLRAIDLAILGTTDLKPILNTVVDKITSGLNAEVVFVKLLDRSSHSLDLAAVGGFGKPHIEELSMQVGDGVPGQAALERETVAVPKLTHEWIPKSLRDIYEQERFISEYSTPLIARGDLIGTLSVLSRAPFEASKDWLEFFETLAGQAAMGIDSVNTFQALQNSNTQLKVAYDKTIEGWSRALEMRDRETLGHTKRVAELTLKLAKKAEIPQEELVHIYRGALLHDIGKMGVPDAILHKPGKLTDEEWVTMRYHTTFAYELLSPIAYLRPAIDIPYCHHEKWDGTGYPRGLSGEMIPLPARLFAIIDVWDALNSDRPYRSAWPTARVFEHIRSEAGTHFCPTSVELFMDLIEAEDINSAVVM